MDRRFIVRPLAEADLEQAANWYDEEQAGLGSRFLSDVDQVFERIRERPQLDCGGFGRNDRRAKRAEP